MKKIFLISILLFFSSNLLWAQDLLKPYLDSAATNSPALKAQFSRYLASLEKTPQLGTLPDPQIAFGYFIQPIETKNGPQELKISVSQMFPWFGSLSDSKDITIEAAKAEYESFKEVKSKIYFEVKSAYYDLYFIRQSIRINQENIRFLKTLQQMALVKIEAGKASSVDELRIEMELADLKNKLALLQDSWKTNLVKFNLLINSKAPLPLVLPDTLWNNSLSLSEKSITDSIQNGNPQLKRLYYQGQSYTRNQALQHKKGMPNILVGLDYTRIGNNNLLPDGGKDALMVKAGISLPVYRKKYKAMLKESTLMQESNTYQQADKSNALETLLSKTYQEYKDANRRTELFAEQKKRAQKAIAILESQYASSGQNFEEIVRMEKRLLQYSLELEKARTDKQTSIAFINYLMGK